MKSNDDFEDLDDDEGCYFPEDEDEDEDDDWDDCGLLPDHLGGGCQLAGSEDCDECPFRDLL